MWQCVIIESSTQLEHPSCGATKSKEMRIGPAEPQMQRGLECLICVCVFQNLVTCGATKSKVMRIGPAQPQMQRGLECLRQPIQSPDLI